MIRGTYEEIWGQSGKYEMVWELFAVTHPEKKQNMYRFVLTSIALD